MCRNVMYAVILGVLALPSVASAFCDEDRDGRADIFAHRFVVRAVPDDGATEGAGDDNERWTVRANVVQNSEHVQYHTGHYGWHPRAVDDFFGDGGCSVLWIHDSSGAAAFRRDSEAMTPPDGDPLLIRHRMTYGIVGTGDLLPGARGRELLAINPQTRQLLAITTDFDATSLRDRPDTVETPTAVGDMNGDGVSDVLFENVSSGSLSVWIMAAPTGNGSTLRRSRIEPISPARPANGHWRLAAVGPFDDNGVDDLLWLNVDEDSQKTVMWFMGNDDGGGGPYRVTGDFTSPDSMASPATAWSAAGDWVIVGPR